LSRIRRALNELDWRDGVAASGILMVANGLWRISPAAALIVVGAVLLGIALAPPLIELLRTRGR